MFTKNQFPIKLFCKFLIFVVCLSYATSSKSEVLDLNISNINSTGQICIAIYKSPDAFYNNKGPNNCLTKNSKIEYHFAKIEHPQSKISKKINISKGVYAIKVFLDKNSNKKIDHNFLGFAKEQVGYSNNPRITMGSPYFSEIEFGISGRRKMEIIL